MPENPRFPGHSAHTIAVRTADVWHHRHGSGHVEVPLSVVAARSHLVDHLVSSTGEEIEALVRHQWRLFVNARPDLAPATAPLALCWHSEQPMTEQARNGAHDVARTAAGASLFTLTSDIEQRRAVDLFGVLLTELKGPRAQSARGAFYTSANMAEALARLVGPTVPGLVHDPTVGTGGLWRTIAAAVREQNQDPTRLEWVDADLDPLAIACTAVNTVLWELGSHVLFAVGDSLTDDVIRAAYAQRQEVLVTARRVRSDARISAAFHTLTRPSPEREEGGPE